MWFRGRNLKRHFFLNINLHFEDVLSHSFCSIFCSPDLFFFSDTICRHFFTRKKMKTEEINFWKVRLNSKEKCKSTMYHLQVTITNISADRNNSHSWSLLEKSLLWDNVRQYSKFAPSRRTVFKIVLSQKWCLWKSSWSVASVLNSNVYVSGFKL